MKKYLAILLSALMIFSVLAIPTSAASPASIDLSNQGYANAVEVTSVVLDENITVSFSKGTNSNTPKYYTSGTSVRVYGGGTFTVSGGTGVTITGITLGFGSSDKDNDITANVGTFTSPSWSGSANSVTFTVGGTSGHRRIKTISVTYTGGSVAPTHPGTEWTSSTTLPTEGNYYLTSDVALSAGVTLTGDLDLCLDGHRIYNAPAQGTKTPGEILTESYALAQGNDLPYEATLTGVISNINTVYSEQYGNITVTIRAAGYDDKPMMCYRLTGGQTLKVGDVITVTGTITNYKGTIEYKQGCTYTVASLADNLITVPAGTTLTLNDCEGKGLVTAQTANSIINVAGTLNVNDGVKVIGNKLGTGINKAAAAGLNFKGVANVTDSKVNVNVLGGTIGVDGLEAGSEIGVTVPAVPAVITAAGVDAVVASYFDPDNGAYEAKHNPDGAVEIALKTVAPTTNTNKSNRPVAFIYVNENYHALLIGGRFLCMPHTDNNTGFCSTCRAEIAPTVEDDTPVEDRVVVLYNADSGKYVTGEGYLYNNYKDELVLADTKDEALVLTVKAGKGGKVSLVTEDGKFLYADGTNVKLVNAAEKNTEFVLEETNGGYFIKCANATYNGKPQYLEVYSGYLTVYGMNTSKAAIYTFELVEVK